ncbi:MAG: hypothetical protein AABW51_03280 [Nanoarchaeota archaeon]
MAKKGIEINKLTNLFLGIALGFLMGYRGGTTNLVLAVCAIIITIILAVVYKNRK